MNPSRDLQGSFLLRLLVLLSAALPARADLLTYVQRPDPAYRWQLLENRELGDVSLTDLHLVSQVWQGITWEHRLRVFRPSPIEFPNTAVLRITGGDASEEDARLNAFLAKMAGMPLALLYQIPNQPLFGDLREDDLIAHTFVRYLETGDEDWPLLLPMTKAAVRAMDALQAFAQSAEGGQQPIRRFIVAGASKRGWTTWLTAVADPRVAGIIPMVYDNLNLFAQMPHQLETWGAFSPQIEEYTRRGLQQQMATERGRRMAEMVDPFTYRDRLALPKLIINGTNDPYWTLDALNLYWDDLVGDKYVLYVPNAGHGLEDLTRVGNTAIAFARNVAGGKAMPRLTWQQQDANGQLRLTVASDPPAREARLWVARSDSKDFRQAEWQEEPMKPANPGFVGQASVPERGSIAIFGEAVYDNDGRSFTLSTQVRTWAAGSE